MQMTCDGTHASYIQYLCSHNDIMTHMTLKKEDKDKEVKKVKQTSLLLYVKYTELLPMSLII